MLSLPSVTTIKTFLSLCALSLRWPTDIYGIPHGSAATRVNTGQRCFHFLDVTSEVLALRQVEVRLVIEVDYENFILRVGGPH